MIIDPKTIQGDIIATVNSKYGTDTQICGRFDNADEYAVYSFIIPILYKLIDDKYLRKCNNGNIHSTRKGIKYIKEHGYFD